MNGSSGMNGINTDVRPTHHLFVYGTLRPGDVRWPLLERFVDGEGVDDTTDGQVFDTGRGYPAAVFGPPGTIRGRTYTLHRPTLRAALAALDHEEGTVAGLYHRVVIVTGSGVAAWAYAYGDGLHLTPIESGDWFDRVS